MNKKFGFENIFKIKKINYLKPLIGDKAFLHEIKLTNNLFNEVKKFEKKMTYNNINLISKKEDKKEKFPIIKEEDISSNHLKSDMKQIVQKKELQKREEENYKYFIKTNKNSFIYIDNQNYGTNDKDLKNLIDLMNESPKKELGYSKVIDEKSCQVYKKQSEKVDVILVKCYANIPYNKDIIFEAITNLEIRMKWDTSFSELRIVNHDGENGAEILYMIVKSPSMFVDDRDFVQQRKIWKEFPTKNSHVLHFKSIDSPSCPKKKGVVRAETKISGYYIQDDPKKPGNSIFGSLSQTDIGGNIPTFLVNQFGPKSSKGWLKNLSKGCKLVLEMKNKH